MENGIQKPSPCSITPFPPITNTLAEMRLLKVQNDRGEAFPHEKRGDHPFVSLAAAHIDLFPTEWVVVRPSKLCLEILVNKGDLSFLDGLLDHSPNRETWPFVTFKMVSNSTRLQLSYSWAVGIVIRRGWT